MKQVPELKIKLKSLTAEARIIREEERKTSGQKRNDLHTHRIHHVRPEARATHLAYGLLRGLTRDRVEQTFKSIPDWKRVRSMVKKYSTAVEQDMAILNHWIERQV